MLLPRAIWCAHRALRATLSVPPPLLAARRGPCAPPERGLHRLVPALQTVFAQPASLAKRTRRAAGGLGTCARQCAIPVPKGSTSQLLRPHGTTSSAQLASTASSRQRTGRRAVLRGAPALQAKGYRRKVPPLATGSASNALQAPRSPPWTAPVHAPKRACCAALASIRLLPLLARRILCVNRVRLATSRPRPAAITVFAGRRALSARACLPQGLQLPTVSARDAWRAKRSRLSMALPAAGTSACLATWASTRSPMPRRLPTSHAPRALRAHSAAAPHALHARCGRSARRARA